jgi:FkbM family methyltransferase
MAELPPHIASSRAAKIREHQARATGILHLGAHTGQEREVYRELGKPVVWVEANPRVFPALQSNIASIPGQSALCALLGDVDGREEMFHISNNFDGVSSSIYPFGEYAVGEKSLWPELNLQMVTTLTLPMVRLDTLLAANQVDVAAYDFWVLDLQGSETVALAGAERSLPHCRCLLAEVSEKEIYQGGPTCRELERFLADQGFAPAWEPHQPHDDVLFLR